MIAKFGVLLLFIASAFSSCPLEIYSTTNVRGYDGLNVEVDVGFVDSMDSIDAYAKECGITVWVVHAFREKEQNLEGTVVPPSTTSNHLVGHAIDMNVETSSGWCNGDCLYAGYDSEAECFIDKVMVDPNLRWGGLWDPSDPVHIDDGLNAYDYAGWEALYYDVQGQCA